MSHMTRTGNLKLVERSPEYVERELKGAFRSVGLDKWSDPMQQRTGDFFQAADGRMLYVFEICVPVDYKFRRLAVER